MVLVPSCIALLQYFSLVNHFTYGTTTGHDNDVITFVSESHHRRKSENLGIRNRADKRRQANSPPAWWNEHPQTRNKPFSASNAVTTPEAKEKMDN
ncbi:hypothetical protein DdX_04050 [Ditylenchus destructor]|uniref:Secreted protein n=1 Tax=Ditylenchus destructor TaxID=166010 RepID=A0AAD4N9U3_9BILA|nr:hypothetical protein DdX_04050 [Ditylenchus destructor]